MTTSNPRRSRAFNGQSSSSTRRQPTPPASASQSSFEQLESRCLLSTTWYVASYGSDHNSGSRTAPLRTIQAAANLAGPGDTVSIHAGTYRETVSPAHSGRAGAPIIFQPYGDGPVVVSGADVVNGWQDVNGAIFATSLPWDLGAGSNQVFVDGQMVNESRWPNTSLDLSHPTFAVASSNTPRVVGLGQWTTATLRDPSLTQPSGFWIGATIHILPGQQWVAQTGTVISSSRGQLTYRYQQMNVPYSLPSAGDRFYLTGTAGALDSAGEWYRDPHSGRLSLWSPGSAHPSDETIEVKHRQDAFNLSGRSYIDIRGIQIFAATIATNSSSNDIVLSGIQAKYVSQFTLVPDGWAPPVSGIELNGHDSTLENSVIGFSAGSGVSVAGSGNTVANCVIHDVDASATSASGIDVFGSNTRIENNTIYNAARDGIKISNSRDTLVLRNLIHDVMLQTTDGGGIYTYGTNGSGSEIAYNRVYHVHSGGYGAAGIYLDNFSLNYKVDHNVVSDCDWALKLNPPSRDNDIVSNVLADSGAPIGTSGSRDMAGTVFASNVYTGSLNVGAGAQNRNNSRVLSANLSTLSDVGANVPTWAITPTPTPAPTPTPVISSPNPTPTTSGGSSSGGVKGSSGSGASASGLAAQIPAAEYRAFLSWYKAHPGRTPGHTPFFEFTRSGYRYAA